MSHLLAGIIGAVIGAGLAIPIVAAIAAGRILELEDQLIHERADRFADDRTAYGLARARNERPPIIDVRESS